MLKTPPPGETGAVAVAWRTDGVFTKHPLMWMLLCKKGTPLPGFAWNDVLDALGVTTVPMRARTTRDFVKHINAVHIAGYEWLPAITADAALPHIDGAGGNASAHFTERALPIFLVPFVRNFVANQQRRTFDTQVHALAGNIMMNLRFEKTCAPLLFDAYAQLIANTSVATHDAMYALITAVDTLRARVDVLEGSPPPPPLPTLHEAVRAVSARVDAAHDGDGDDAVMQIFNAGVRKSGKRPVVRDDKKGGERAAKRARA